MTRPPSSALRAVLLIALIGSPLGANASAHTGTVAMLELWPNGNVAFSLNGAALPCNGQIIINASSDGVKNMYAALLGAKLSGKPVMLHTTSCGPADGYSPSILYAVVDYLYVLD